MPWLYVCNSFFLPSVRRQQASCSSMHGLWRKKKHGRVKEHMNNHKENYYCSLPSFSLSLSLPFYSGTLISPFLILVKLFKELYKNGNELKRLQKRKRWVFLRLMNIRGKGIPESELENNQLAPSGDQFDKNGKLFQSNSELLTLLPIYFMAPQKQLSTFFLFNSCSVTQQTVLHACGEKMFVRSAVSCICVCSPRSSQPTGLHTTPFSTN